MENSHDSEKVIEDTRRLENLIGSYCEGAERCKFVPAYGGVSSGVARVAYLTHIGDENLIKIDMELVSEVENLSKYDKKYLSALKMVVYHEIGHALFDKFCPEPNSKEEIAELYAISRGSIDDYIIEIAVGADLRWNKISECINPPVRDPEELVENILKKDSVDKWENKRFAYKFNEYDTYNVAKNALDKIKLPYKEIFDRVLKEMEQIDSLKRKNNLFIDKDMISRK